MTGLREVFADPLFRDSGLTAQDIQEVAAASPTSAEAIATLYRAYQQAVVNTSLLAERLADRDLLDGGQTLSAPLEEVRDFINSPHWTRRRRSFTAMRSLARTNLM